jgi:hypothetical protein
MFERQAERQSLPQIVIGGIQVAELGTGVAQIDQQPGPARLACQRALERGNRRSGSAFRRWTSSAYPSADTILS